jgi:hypothetical protein
MVLHFGVPRVGPSFASPRSHEKRDLKAQGQYLSGIRYRKKKGRRLTMPRGNRTGPAGTGPMSGRGALENLKKRTREVESSQEDS